MNVSLEKNNGLECLFYFSFSSSGEKAWFIFYDFYNEFQTQLKLPIVQQLSDDAFSAPFP